MKILLTLSFQIFFVLVMTAQWESMNGPFGGIIFNLVQNDQFQFVGTSNGLYRSNDRGLTWSHQEFVPEITYTCKEIGIFENLIIANAHTTIDLNPSTHYFKSEDNGNSWNELILPNGIGGGQIEINKYGIYLQSTDKLWVSIDNGINWTESNLSIDGPFTYHLFSYDGHIYTASGNVVYMSATNTDEWTNIPMDSIGFNIVSIYAIDSILFVRDSDGANLFRTSNKGITWSQLDDLELGSWDPGIVKIGDVMVTAGAFSFYSSNDLGVSWQAINSTDFIEPLEMINIGDTILTGNFGQGIQLSTNLAQTFRFSNKGLDAAYVGKISSDSAYIWAANAWGGIWRQSRLSGEWEPVTSLSETLEVADITTQDQNVYALSAQHVLYTSSDQGITWRDITPHGFSSDYTEIFIDGASVLIGGNIDFEDSAIRYTQDTGSSWTLMTVLIDDELFFPSLYARNSNAIFTIAYERIFRSIDNGQTWDELINGPFLENGCTHCEFIQLFTSDSMIFALEMNDYYHSTRLHASGDNGENWEIVDFGFPETGFNAGFMSYSTVDNIILATDLNFENRSIRASFDGGHSSILFNDGLPTKKITRIGSDANYLYAATSGHGLWRRKISDLYTVATNEIHSAAELNIYPNPSNGNINLRIEPMLYGHARLVITDIQGTAIESRDIYFEGHMEVDTEKLPSGIYILTLQTDEHLYSGKFINLK